MRRRFPRRSFADALRALPPPPPRFRLADGCSPPSSAATQPLSCWCAEAGLFTQAPLEPSHAPCWTIDEPRTRSCPRPSVHRRGGSSRTHGGASGSLPWGSASGAQPSLLPSFPRPPGTPREPCSRAAAPTRLALSPALSGASRRSSRRRQRGRGPDSSSWFEFSSVRVRLTSTTPLTFLGYRSVSPPAQPVWGIELSRVGCSGFLRVSRPLLPAPTGLGEGVAFPAVHSLISQFVPSKWHSTSVGIVTAASYAGAALAFVAVPPLIEACPASATHRAQRS